MITALGASLEVARWLHEYSVSWDELILGRDESLWGRWIMDTREGGRRATTAFLIAMNFYCLFDPCPHACRPPTPWLVNENEAMTNQLLSGGALHMPMRLQASTSLFLLLFRGARLLSRPCCDQRVACRVADPSHRRQRYILQHPLYRAHQHNGPAHDYHTETYHGARCLPL